MLTPFPSATALALALGARLTLRGSTLRRNPWTFGVRVSHPDLRYSCQHSHFRCLHQGSRARLRRPTERSATASEDRDQEVRDQNCARWQRPCSMRAISDVLAPPALGRLGSRYSRDRGIARPYLHLVGRADRHHQQSGETRLRTDAACQTLRPRWHRSISTPAGSGPPAQTARSVETPGSPGAPPATADRRAGIPRGPRPTTTLAFHLVLDF